MLSETIPGTNISYDNYEETFENYRKMIEMTGGLSLGQICTITGLQTSAIQNWVKRGFVPHPENKKYFERHVSRILLINSLKDCMNIDDVGELMVLINGDTDDESDDIVSETRLYGYLCQIIHDLDFKKLDDETIEKVICDIIRDEDIHCDRLKKALKVMTYAFISGQCFKQTKAYLHQLRSE